MVQPQFGTFHLTCQPCLKQPVATCLPTVRGNPLHSPSSPSGQDSLVVGTDGSISATLPQQDCQRGRLLPTAATTPESSAKHSVSVYH